MRLWQLTLNVLHDSVLYDKGLSTFVPDIVPLLSMNMLTYRQYCHVLYRADTVIDG